MIAITGATGQLGRLVIQQLLQVLPAAQIVAAVRRPDLSEPVEGEHGGKVALVAARLGKTRLIDNLEW